MSKSIAASAYVIGLTGMFEHQGESPPPAGLYIVHTSLEEIRAALKEFEKAGERKELLLHATYDALCAIKDADEEPQLRFSALVIQQGKVASLVDLRKHVHVSVPGDRCRLDQLERMKGDWYGIGLTGQIEVDPSFELAGLLPPLLTKDQSLLVTSAPGDVDVEDLNGLGLEDTLLEYE